MTDYFKDTGSTGQMLIRDNGTTVTFYINSGNSSSFNHQLPWGYIVNGANVGSLEADYSAGMGWLLLRSFTVTTSQTVTFKLGDTGTGGMGGPTNFSVAINRVQKPNPPSAVTATAVGSTAINVKFTYGAANGDAVDSGQIAYSQNSNFSPATIIGANGSASITGLVRGARYYFKARNTNSAGTSDWGPTTSYVLLDYPDQGTPVTFSEVRQTSVKASIGAVGNGGAAIDSYQILWTLNSSPESGDFDVVSVPQAPFTYLATGLLPGRTYNFFSRPHNSVGWGPWSPARAVKTFAGAYVKVGTEYKQAIPWVRVGGIWKPAKPWGKVSGSWRESI